ncbi:histone acetyltransferase [Vibrio tarriae]|uniref:Histone acetyltransferase n=1 Tax=Vibrio tarriae TaxID=2014742 RepID=A0AAU8W8N3_9VIBR|nr:GNAT family N-acetyltransferase [Vibrio tarriae]ASK53383.1 histone acetyltransferase [Vibrio tarriae]
MRFEAVQAKMDISKDLAQLTSELGYKASHKETENWLSELISSPLHFVFVAVSDLNVCGWIVVEKRVFLESGFIAEITGLIVGAEYRRNGIAEALVNAAEKWASSQGLKQIVVRSNVSREESHVFYRSIGFTHSKTSHVYVKRLNFA